MASFLTRVELHCATSADYDKLHAAMLALNFSKFIAGDDGSRYELPTAEYYCSGEVSAEQVKVLADQAAVSTGRRYWVIAAQYSYAAWTLQQA
jgi:hypothetical protein